VTGADAKGKTKEKEKTLPERKNAGWEIIELEKLEGLLGGKWGG
jgi:hypothetical protein